MRNIINQKKIKLLLVCFALFGLAAWAGAGLADAGFTVGFALDLGLFTGRTTSSLIIC